MGLGEQRFPPPEFESGHQLPISQNPPPRSLGLEYLDVLLLVICLGMACHFVYRRRSRNAMAALSLFSLVYFGFYRKGCICAIGSVQNVAFSLVDSSYALPLTALAFFVIPLVVSLFAGRSFCAAVCPHGALQDLVLLKPLSVPIWLEHGLGLIPYLYLGAGVAMATTGTAFLICRYDPFVPLFRLTGSVPLVVSGIVLLVLATFVGRPYCRFLCPYGAALALAAKVSKWRVRITPDVCNKCRLCEQSCPFGAIQHPVDTHMGQANLAGDRRRLTLTLVLLPVFIIGSAWMGSKLGRAGSFVHPTVALAERYLTDLNKPARSGVQTAAALSLGRAAQNPGSLLESAIRIRQKCVRAGWWFGGWSGLVVGFKLLALALRQRRAEFEPDRGRCFACARCFEFCPNERLRVGLTTGATAMTIRPATAARSTMSNAGDDKWP
jgi:ferredoxin